MADALSALVAGEVAGRERDALVAFIDAWRQHWPSSFAAALRERAEVVTRWAGSQHGDEGRRLKLRRIALANLAHTL